MLSGACAASSPTVDASSGVVYVVVAHDILAFDACTGSRLWRSSLKATPGKIIASPSVLRDGTLVFGSMDKQVYAIHRTGEERWRTATGGYVTGTPLQALDGTVHVGSWDGHFYVLAPETGLVLRRYTGVEAFAGSAALGPDGVAYVASNAGSIFAMAAPTKDPVVLPLESALLV